jgi:TonB family protein
MDAPNSDFGFGDEAYTDANGYFRFTKIPAGSFYLNSAIDFFPPTEVRLSEGDHAEQDVRMVLAPFTMDFVVCAECPPPPAVEPYVAPPSLVKEFQHDREESWKAAVVGPAPIGGWEFDQPRPIPYPEPARRARVEGTVVIDGQIGPDGFVTDIRVASGHPLLTDGTVAVLRDQRWEPARVRGNAVGIPMHAEFRYVLKRRP